MKIFDQQKQADYTLRIAVQTQSSANYYIVCID